MAATTASSVHPAPTTMTPAYRRRVLGTLMFVQVMAGLGHGMTFSMGSLLATKLQGAAWGGTALALTMGGAGLWAIPLARIVAAKGRRTSLSVGLGLGILGALSALSGAVFEFFPLLLVGFILLGAEVAVTLQARFAASDIANPQHRGRDLSLVMWSTTIGAVVGPQLFGFTESLGAGLGLPQYAGAYVLCIGVQLLGVLALQLGIHPELSPRTAPAAAAGAGGAARAGAGGANAARDAIWAHPRVVAAIVTAAISHFVMIGIMSMTAVHLHGHGSSLSMIGIVISGHVGAMYALAPLFGILADRFGAVPTIALGTVINIISAAVVWVWADSHTGVLIGLVLLGFGWSGTLIGTSALIISAAPQHLLTRFQGRSDMVMNVGGTIGGIAAGPIVSSYGLAVLSAAMIVVIVVQITLTVLGVRAATARQESS